MAEKSTVEAEVLNANAVLLRSIDLGDWQSYEELCDAAITCFEPEARGHLVQGLPFHKFYFDLVNAFGSSPAPSVGRQSTMSSPNVRVVGDMAVLCYVRVVQKLDEAGSPVTAVSDETRIWRKVGDNWKHIHFHRS